MAETDAIDDHNFPCDACGSDLRFSPGAEKLECDHCGHVQSVDGADGPWGGGAIVELDFRSALAGQLDTAEMEETRTVHCDSCGAVVEFSDQDHAKECPFCASPVVVDTGSNRHIKPKGVLPFSISEKQARQAMTEWLGSLWFAPNSLSDYARAGRRLNGVYAPHWTYDADTKTRYTGQRGTRYYVNQTVTVMVDGKPQQQTRRVAKMRWTPVSGRVARFFDDVLVLASKSLPRKYTDRLAPWDLAALEPYRPEYLAGFRAEAYTVDLEEGFHEARAIMDATILRDIRFDIGGDAQRVGAVDTAVSDVTFKHILLPVWMAAYKYQGKSYRFVVNGRTGAVQGERPYSVWKIALAVLAGLIVAGGLGYLYAINQ